MTRTLWCCSCNRDVNPNLTSGAEVYPHRKDLHRLPFWSCGTCGNYVGCHPGTPEPLGVIPTKEIRKIRTLIHSTIDPLWKSKRIDRGDLYRMMSGHLGLKSFHAANLRTLEEAERAYKVAIRIAEEIGG